MNPSRRSSIVRSLAAIAICLMPVIIARAQGEVGPQTVWQPDQAAQAALYDCIPVDGCTLSGVMAAHGATPEAVAFAQAHDDHYYLAAFTEQGRVDLGMLFAPMAANGNRAYQLLNGNPPIVDAQSARDADARAHPAYAPLYARYPNLFLWGSDSVFDGKEPRPDGGQRFLFSYPLIDGCHACDRIDMARVAYDFDAAGTYLGLTYLDPASVAAAAPPAADPNRPKRQIAYTIPMGERARAGRGNIWLVEEDGGNPTQLSTSGLDCCATWSPDGTRLYYVRNSAAAADPGPSAIIERDMATGTERTIGPSTSIGSALTVSSDGQTLAYVANSPMPPPGPNEAILVDNLACLNLLNLESNQSIQLDCLEQGFIGEAEFLAHEPALLAVQGGFEWTQIVTYPLFPSEPVPFPDVCCFSVQVASRDKRVYAVGNDYYMFTQFQANGWEGFGIFEYGQGIREPVPLLISAEPLYALDLSPEEDRLVYDRGGQIEILDLSNRATTPVVAGMQPAWRPGGALVAPPIDDLLARKQQTFARLETTIYTSWDGIIFPEPIPAFDETAARELVAELRAADPATITPEQAAALERLVMQEETLAVLLEHYSVLADDKADVIADFTVLVAGTGLLADKAGSGAQSALAGLARKAIEDFIKLWLNVIEDQALREAAQDAVDIVSRTINQDIFSLAEDFAVRALSDSLRALAAGRLIPAIVADGQPTVDQAVRSVRGESPGWLVEGVAESAALQLDGLVTQSALVSDLAHNIYVDDLGEGREFNELIKDIGDLLSVGSAGNPWARLVSIQTRVQQVLIDAAAYSVLSEAMTCTRDAAARSGDYAFRPSQPVYQCRVPVPLDLGDFFNRLFTERTGRFGLLSPAAQSVSPEFDTALAAYRAALDGLRSAVASGEAAAVEVAADELATAAAALDAPTAAVMARLDPLAEGADPTGQMALGVALTTVRLDAVLALLAADAWLADPAAADPAAFGQLLGTAAANAVLPSRVLAVAPPPPPPAAARPVVDAPATWAAVAGEPLAIPIAVMNIGGAALVDGRLSLELDGEVVAEAPLPALAPGASAAVSPDLAPAAPGRYLLRIVAGGGDRPDYRTVDLLVEDAAQATTAESSTLAPPADDVETDRPPADAPETGVGWLRPVLLGVMLVAGALFIIALAAYLRQSRRD